MRAAFLLLAFVLVACTTTSAADDLPRVYSEGCHLAPEEFEPHACIGGDLDARSTAYLFGDSHAAQWFPALDALAAREGLRLVSHTKSACPPWDGPVLLKDREYTECELWRQAVMAEIEAAHPAVVFITSSRRYVLPGAVLVRGDNAAWAEGMHRTLAALDAAVLVAETPWLHDGTPSREGGYEALERSVAEATGTVLVDACAPGCPATAYRDDHHLTATYSASLWQRFEQPLNASWQ